MPALPLVAGNMLYRGATGVAGELCQAGLMDGVAAARFDADHANMLQAFYHAEHADRVGGLRHLFQPCQPTLPRVLPTL